MSKTVNISPNSTNWHAYEHGHQYVVDYFLFVTSKNKVPFTGCTGCTITISGQWNSAYFAFKMVFPAVSKVVTLDVTEVS